MYIIPLQVHFKSTSTLKSYSPDPTTNSETRNSEFLFSFFQVHIDAVGLSEILKGKQNLGVTFNFDKQDVIDFTKFSKMTMCRASEANS